MATESVESVVEEMRAACEYAMNNDRAWWLDRILSAAALERAEHRRQLEEALAEPTAGEISLMATTLKECLRIELDGKQGPLQPGDWSAEGGVIDLDRVARAVFVVARARIVKEG